MTDLDTKLATERDRMAVLRELATSIGTLPLDRATEALPQLAAAIENLERCAQRIKLPRRYPEGDEFADVQSIATGPIDPTLIVRE